MQSELKIDMDWIAPDDYLVAWVDLMDRLLLAYGIQRLPKVRMEKSCNHTGLHVRVPLASPIDDTECLLLQFLLGDDRTRCRLNLARKQAGIKAWNKLFYRKVPRVNQSIEGGL